MQRIFVHLPPFERRWREFELGDEELRLLQVWLLLYPTDGAVVKGTNGIRKVRWNVGGKGKRGGLRIFYVDFPNHGLTFLITAIKKSQDTDLDRGEQDELAELVLQLTRRLRRSGEN